jgi:hypothetical protein
MAVQDENKVLAEAKELYNALARKAGGGGAGGSSSDNPVGSMNRAVMDAVSKTVQVPLLGIMSDVHAGTESSRNLASTVGGVRGPLQKELEDMPRALNIDALTTDLPATVRSVLDTMKSAAADPSVLYPRLLCGSIPVDPAKLANLAKKYKALELLDGASGGGANDGTAQARALRGPPGSTADVVSGITGAFHGVAEPLMAALEKLRSVREKVSVVGEGVRRLDDGQGPLDDLLSQQHKVGELLERLTGMFSKDGPGTPTSARGAESATASRSFGLDSPATNALAIVEEGTQLVRSAESDLRRPLEQCIERVKAAGDKIAGLAAELKELFQLAMESFGRVAELLRTFTANLPRIAAEVRHFFIPTGLRALFLQPSEHTAALLASVEKLKTAAPDPEKIESAARSVLQESESASKVALITSKVRDVVRAPTDMIAKLVVMSRDLPGKVLAAAKAALKAWAAEFGERVVGNKIEDSVCGVAGAVGGESVANAVADFLPFGRSDKHGADGGGPGNSAGGTGGGAGGTGRLGGKLAGVAGGLFKSLF